MLTLRGGFNTNLVIASTSLLGLAAGVVGVFALLRKRALMTDALSHATLPGIVLAFLIAGAFGADGRSLPVLLLGATATGVAGVLCVHAILRYSRLHEDAAIGAVLSVFFGAGVVGLSYVQENAPAGSSGLKTFIYGQAATAQVFDVALIGGIAVVAIASTGLLIKPFAVVCFDASSSRADGWPVGLIDIMMMTLIVGVTVAGLQAVGLIMVIALLIIPPVAARFWTDRLSSMVIISGAVGAASGYLGSVLSALLDDAPAGATIVMAAGAVFVASLVTAPRRGVVAAAVRRAQLRMRIGGDHLLEHAFSQPDAVITAAELARLARARGWSRWFCRVLVASLLRAGLISCPRRGVVSLTPRGIVRGRRVARNHALWEQYLISYADVAPSHVDWSVDQVEHVLSDDLIAELEARLADRGLDLAEPAGATA